MKSVSQSEIAAQIQSLFPILFPSLIYVLQLK
jgi:hypothetical protein